MNLVKFIVLAMLASLMACQEEVQVKPEWRDVPGEIQILNSSGVNGAAGEARDFLRKKGFDVVEVGNDAWWNYEETVIALRNPHWPGKDALAKALNTTNIIPLENKLKLVDATVFVGKNFHKLTEQP